MRTTKGKHLPGKSKSEFAKKLAVAIFVIATANIAMYHVEVVLAIKTQTGIMPDATVVTQSIITIFGGFLSYCLYQFGLKNSRNKYKVDADGNPFEQPPPEESNSPGAQG